MKNMIIFINKYKTVNRNYNLNLNFYNGKNQINMNKEKNYILNKISLLFFCFFKLVILNIYHKLL